MPGDVNGDARVDGADEAALTAALELAGGGFFQLGTGLPYDPASGRFGTATFVLTAPDGARYEYDAAGALRQISLLTGQKVLWSDSGVVGLNGNQIGFQHDAAGRLTLLAAPDGTRVIYRYDQAGNLQVATNLANGSRGFFGYEGGHLLNALISSGTSANLAPQYDAQGRLLNVASVDLALGTSRQFLGQIQRDSLSAGQTRRYALILTDTEVATPANRSVLLGIDLRGAAGLALALPKVPGATLGVNRIETGRSLGIYTFSSGGAQTFEVAGSTSSAAGN